MQKAKCRSCQAEILWLKSATTGNLMPLDAEPVAKGNVAIIDGMAHVFNGSLFEDKLPDGPRYLNHFATCPSAEQHTRKKPKKGKP